MKKLIALFLTVIFAFSLVGCKDDLANIENVKIDYGKSEIYSKEDMDNAIEIILDEFKLWNGFELYTISYTSDDECKSNKNIKWANDLADGRGLEPNFDEYIQFKSDFHTSKNASDEGFEEDSDYNDWSWHLARSNGGQWHLISWGY